VQGVGGRQQREQVVQQRRVLLVATPLVNHTATIHQPSDHYFRQPAKTRTWMRHFAFFWMNLIFSPPAPTTSLTLWAGICGQAPQQRGRPGG
jgi:hypothetical protein